jgi:hypothetical protein
MTVLPADRHLTVTQPSQAGPIDARGPVTRTELRGER